MKTQRLSIFLGITTIALVGCGSFNHYAIPDGAVFMLQTAPAKSERDNDASPPPSCPLFKLPEADKMPEVPLEELRAIDPHDAEAIDAIQQKHIADLRKYMVNYQRTIQRAYRNYQLSCQMKGVVIG